MNKRKINSQTGTNSTQDTSQEPTAFNEKRKKYNQPTYVSPSQKNTKEKRFSRNLNDLSMLNDLSLDQVFYFIFFLINFSKIKIDFFIESRRRNQTCMCWSHRKNFSKKL